MPYCTSAQVRAIVDSDVTDDEITELIEESDAWLDIKLVTASLGTIFLRMLSRTLTSVRVMLKDPNSQKLGEYSEDREAALLKLNAMLDEMLADAGGETSGGIGFQYGYAALPRGYVSVG